MAQNLPSLARALLRTKMNGSVAEELTANTRHWPAGASAALLNGVEIPLKPLDLFGLLPLLRREVALADGLQQLGLSEEMTGQLSTVRPSAVSARIDMRGAPAEGRSGRCRVVFGERFEG